MSDSKQTPSADTIAALAELDGIDSVAQLSRSRFHTDGVTPMLRLAGRGADRCVLARPGALPVQCREPVRV